MNLGWIKLHRSLLDHWAASEPEMLATWIRLLLEANHEDKKHLFNGSLIEVKRGELIFGLNAFSDKTGISIKKLRRYLDMFEKDGMIGRQKTNKFSIISITCYDSYQNEGSQKASKGQAEGRQRATPKEDKENKEVKEDIHAPKRRKVNESISEIDWTIVPEMTEEHKGILMDNRKVKKKANTSRGIKPVLKQIRSSIDSGISLDLIFDTIAAKGWADYEHGWKLAGQNQFNQVAAYNDDMPNDLIM